MMNDFVVKNAVEVGGPTKVTVGDAATGGSYTAGYDLSVAAYDSVSFSVASQVTSQSGIYFGSGGTKAYVMQGGGSVFQYTMSSGYDISTLSYDSKSFSPTSQDGYPIGFTLRENGTKFYMLGYNTGTVYQYSMSTAWDISTASYDSVSFSVSSQASVGVGLVFKTDGTKMYVLCNSTNAIYQYSLSTAWDVSTASYDSVSLSISAQETDGNYLKFSNDGLYLLTTGNSGDGIDKYTLSTAWDISTATFDTFFSTSSQDTSPFGIETNSDGTKTFVLGNTNNTIYQYSTGSTVTTGSFDLSTGNYFTDTPSADVEYTFSNAGDVQSFQLEVTGNTSYYNIVNATLTGSTFSFSSQTSNVLGCAFGDNGTKLYAFQNSSSIYQYTLTTAYDLSTASYASKSFNIATQDTNMRSIVWKSDGTAFFTLGATNDYVYKYTCSTAWDVSTASYIHASPSLASDLNWTTPLGLEMSPDGTKFFIGNAGGGGVARIEEWSMSTAYDLTTASQTDIFNLVNSEALPDGLSFNSDGTQLFVLCYSTIKLWKYSLSTPYDLTTISYSGDSFDASVISTTVTEVMFNDSGSKMYIAMYSGATLYELSTASVSTITWDADIAWPSGTAPDSPAAGEKDIYTFTTDDGGTTYIGVQSGDAFS